MAAPKGNQFWKARTKHGRDAIFADPEVMWEACQEYFEWVESNPLYEAKAFAFQGVVTIDRLPKMRAMTITGMCLFLGISEKCWQNYRQREDFVPVTTRVEAAIFSQKFEGASADMLNANIIARHLGLSDKSEITGANGGPIQTEEVSAKDAVRAFLEGKRPVGS